MSDFLDKQIIDELITYYKLEKDIIDDFFYFFKDKIKPEIKKIYLSHLITSIIDIINENQRLNILNNLNQSKQNNEINNKADFNAINKALKSKQLRLFTINLIPLNINSKKAFTKIIRGVAFIYYDNRIDDKQKRLLISHELGHIVLKYIFNKYPNNDINASLFGIIAMIDKNKFYTSECKDFTYISDIQLFNEYINLIPKL